MTLYFKKMLTTLAEKGGLPDFLVRYGIRNLLKNRLNKININNIENSNVHLQKFLSMMGSSEVALVPELANEQHYEVPPDFFKLILGKNLKYSCGYWENEKNSLNDSEESALAISTERAMIKDGEDVLDLGCGWGSFSLRNAKIYSKSRFTAVSNSKRQKLEIDKIAKENNLENLEVITDDINYFVPNKSYDRIVSIEMFEHIRNYKEMFKRVSDWLNPSGTFFMHIFCHRSVPYEFIEINEDDWMAKYFFSGGIMPSLNLPLNFQEDLSIINQWVWSGSHYQKTSNAWLKNMDRNKREILYILSETYGKNDEYLWWMRWRMFFMSCAELFGYDNGQEWLVSHYLFKKKL
jgi:cyclopropane-fatty-acyl-phospholipid synthase